MSNQTDIDKQLEEALAAQAELAVGDALRAKAEKVPDLLREKKLQDARERAVEGVETAIMEASPKYAELAQKVPVLRKRLQALIDAVKPLADDIRKAQNEIIAAGEPLLAACEAYDQAYGHGQQNPLEGIPLMLQVASRFDEVLQSAGATKPELDFTPTGGLPEWMRVLLHAQRTDIVYRPGRGSANWRRRF